METVITQKQTASTSNAISSHIIKPVSSRSRFSFTAAPPARRAHSHSPLAPLNRQYVRRNQGSRDDDRFRRKSSPTPSSAQRLHHPPVRALQPAATPPRRARRNTQH